jgi:hypothetical protein
MNLINIKNENQLMDHTINHIALKSGSVGSQDPALKEGMYNVFKNTFNNTLKQNEKEFGRNSAYP